MTNTNLLDLGHSRFDSGNLRGGITHVCEKSDGLAEEISISNFFLPYIFSENMDIYHKFTLGQRMEGESFEKKKKRVRKQPGRSL